MRKEKVVFQTEAAECGLACLAMVCQAHGNNVSLRELRDRFQLSTRGIALPGLMAAARQLGFQTRALRLDLGGLAKLKSPSILHWGLSHFVVLLQAGRSRITILDPAAGRRTLTYAEVSDHFTGVALEFERAVDFSPQAAAPSVSLQQLTGPVTGLWRTLTLVFSLSLILQACVLVSPIFLQWVVDQVLVSTDNDLLVILAVGFGLVALLQAGVGLLRGWAVVYLSSQLGLQWMGNVFAHLLRLPLDYFERRHVGDVLSRMGSVQTIQRTLTTSFVEALIDGLMAAITFVMMLVYSWKLALVTMVAVALYLCMRAILFKPMREATEQQLGAAAKQQSHLLESINGIQSLKVAGAEQLRQSTYSNLMNETVNREVWLKKLEIVFNSASQLVFGLERLLAIWIGALLATQNLFSVGMLVAYLAYREQFSQRVSSLIDRWIEFRMLRLHGERLSDIVLSMPDEATRLTAALATPTDSTIVVRNLSFRYGQNDPWVVSDCSFTVQHGESVAIVGASGAGKTTLVKLLLGLQKAAQGTISVGGTDISMLGASGYRGMIGAVLQEDQLFSGSVAGNIAFGSEDSEVDPERIAAAARRAAVHDDIVAMPMGYDTLIGDMGMSVSGGQKQRILLARALYRRPRILFLDEATSHLDVERERAVNEAVKQLELTKVIIAHRPETIASADRILVMRDGQVVERPKLAQIAPTRIVHSPDATCLADSLSDYS